MEQLTCAEASNQIGERCVLVVQTFKVLRERSLEVVVRVDAVLRVVVVRLKVLEHVEVNVASDADDVHVEHTSEAAGHVLLQPRVVAVGVHVVEQIKELMEEYTSSSNVEIQ